MLRVCVCNIYLRPDIELLAPHTVPRFPYLCLALPFVLKAGSSHLFLPHSCYNYHLMLHAHAHLCLNTHAKLTNQTCLWSLKKLLKMSTSNFYSAHMHALSTSEYILTADLHTYFDVPCCLCLGLWGVTHLLCSFCHYWRKLIVSSAAGYRFTNCYEITELFKRTASKPEELAA